jgi:predicted secreted protein
MKVLVLDPNEGARTVSLKVGEQITVKMAARNGFLWQLVHVSNGTVEQVGDMTVDEPNSNQAHAVPRFFVWRFDGVKLGRAELTFSYGYAMPETTKPELFKLTVVVYDERV